MGRDLVTPVNQNPGSRAAGTQGSRSGAHPVKVDVLDDDGGMPHDPHVPRGRLPQLAGRRGARRNDSQRNAEGNLRVLKAASDTIDLVASPVVHERAARTTGSRPLAAPSSVVGDGANLERAPVRAPSGEAETNGAAAPGTPNVRRPGVGRGDAIPGAQPAAARHPSGSPSAESPALLLQP